MTRAAKRASIRLMRLCEVNQALRKPARSARVSGLAPSIMSVRLLVISGKIALSDTVSEALSLLTECIGLLGVPNAGIRGAIRKTWSLTHNVVLIRGEEPCSRLRYCHVSLPFSLYFWACGQNA